MPLRSEFSRFANKNPAFRLKFCQSKVGERKKSLPRLVGPATVRAPHTLGMEVNLMSVSLRTVSVSAVALAVCASAALVGAPAADAAYGVSGNITCVDGQDISGVWIAAQGNSGYATVHNLGSGNAQFSRANVSGPWTVHVGCGGNANRWQYTPNGNVTVNTAAASWTCYTPDTSRPVNFCQHT